MVYKLGTSYGCHLNLKITLTDEFYDFKQSLKDLFNSYPTKKTKHKAYQSSIALLKSDRYRKFLRYSTLMTYLLMTAKPS